MKTFNTYFENQLQFTNFIQQTEIDLQIKNSKSLLVQIFSGIVQEEYLNTIVDFINNKIPKAIVIGATTAGEINNGKITSHKIIVSFSFFDKTDLEYFKYEYKGINTNEFKQLQNFSLNDDPKMVCDLACSIKNNIVKPNTKCILLFISYSASEGYLLLKELNKQIPGIPVFGGVAGDNLQYVKRLVFGNEMMSLTGLVAVSLNSDHLQIHSDYHLNWQTIGKVFTVTDAESNLIKTIDHIPAAEIYRRYLGEFTPGGGLEFPLIFNIDGMQVARVPGGLTGNDSISISSTVEIGDKFQFSYGHIESILSKTDDMLEAIKKNPVESIFVYSCAARRSFLQNACELETLPLNDIAPNVGFFTYGEFYHSCSNNQLLNETMTLLMLSETDEIAEYKIKNKSKKQADDYIEQKTYSVLAVMNRLITQVTSELNESNEKINTSNEELTSLLEEVRKNSAMLEAKNKNITDSIQYAKRIQSAILPSLEFMAQCIPDNFIFFQPKDIVSGDFFWLKDLRCNDALPINEQVCDITNNTRKIIFAAADCTGHGVPGAFMSMLGIAFLNEIVGKYIETQTTNDLHANQILTDLRRKVKSALRQTGKEGESKDGMDIALCMVDVVNRTIEYAGANNPLWIVRKYENQQAELIEYKADKMPIGIYLHENDQFTNHIIQLQKGDTIYMCSDGFEDQFGGEKGRKFLSKNLKQLLIDINPLSIEAQKVTIETTFKQWIGINEQVDDVLVMGMRL